MVPIRPASAATAAISGAPARSWRSLHFPVTADLTLLNWISNRRAGAQEVWSATARFQRSLRRAPRRSVRVAGRDGLERLCFFGAARGQGPMSQEALYPRLRALGCPAAEDGRVT